MRQSFLGGSAAKQAGSIGGQIAAKPKRNPAGDFMRISAAAASELLPILLC